LKAAECHIASLSREHIAHQREIISHLEHDGHHVAAEKAAALLALLLDTQALHEQDRERIEQGLAKIRNGPYRFSPQPQTG
jgi:hypothetical protein